MLGISMAFWVGMGVVTAIVVAGCAVAWLMPVKKSPETLEKTAAENA